MKSLKVIILLSSLLLFNANAKAEDLIETKGSFGKMPSPIFLGEDLKYSIPTFLWRRTQYMRFRLKKYENDTVYSYKQDFKKATDYEWRGISTIF